MRKYGREPGQPEARERRSEYAYRSHYRSLETLKLFWPSGACAIFEGLLTMQSHRLRRSVLSVLLVTIFCIFALDPHFASAADEKPATVKTSSVIATAGEANLANGNGDVSPSGLKWLPTACALRIAP